MNEFQVPGLSAVSQSQTVNYFRLESESSMQSEDTESVTSLQGRETEYAKDSEDTDELSDEYLEYEVASLSEADVAPSGASSSYGTDDDIKFAEEVIAAVLGDTSVEAWSADGGEDSCSSTESEDTSKTDFRICAQCKSKNSNPRFLFCEKCYQSYETILEGEHLFVKIRNITLRKRERIWTFVENAFRNDAILQQIYTTILYTLETKKLQQYSRKIYD